MKADLPQRAQALFDRHKAFPEAGYGDGHVTLRRDAYVSFLDLRQLFEREILAALDELKRLQGEG